VSTNSAGQFNVPVLPAGVYSVTVEQSGFSKLEQSNLEVTVGRAVNLSLELKPGAIGEIINVTADGSQPDGTNARRLQLSFRFRF
jgi:hypothetical protein